MFQSESEAWLAANKLAMAENLDLDSDPYIPIYNQKKQGWLLYPRVATLEVKAMRSGTYMGKDNCEFDYDTAAKVTVYRNLLDQKCAFSSDTIMLSEYATKKWHTDKPYMFLAKIALGRALRHAFPDLFGVQITYEEAMCQLEFDKHPVREDLAKKQPKTTETSRTVTSEIPFSNTSNVTKLVAEVFGKAHII